MHIYWQLFPIPITLDLDKDFSEQVEIGQKILLKDKEGFKITILTIDSIWEPDFYMESELSVWYIRPITPWC